MSLLRILIVLLLLMEYVALHVGAGKHSDEKWIKYKRLCRMAAKYGMDMLDHGASAEKVAVDVGRMLEMSPLTNAGVGSQLTEDGLVECDAAIVSLDHLEGMGVGAVQGVANPIALVSALRRSFGPNYTQHGRTLPVLVTGQSAVARARQEDDKEVIFQPPHCLITPQALAIHEYWKRVLDQPGQSASQSAGQSTGLSIVQGPTQSSQELGLGLGAESAELLDDTIGVICRDKTGQVVVVSSSGGPTFRISGRIGPAAMVGSGLAIARAGVNCISTVASGHGESIVGSNLAGAAGQLIASRQLDPVSSPTIDTAALPEDSSEVSDLGIQLESSIRRPDGTPQYMGIMAVVESDNRSRTQLGYAFGTESMIMAYATSADRLGVVIAERNEGLPFHLRLGPVHQRDVVRGVVCL